MSAISKSAPTKNKMFGTSHSTNMEINSAEMEGIEIPALGRPFRLGMLYNCCSDKLIPGVTLWNMETLEKNIDRRTQEYTAFELITSDTISDKTNALKITASLKASFLGDLITVDGSANYLNDTKKSKHQCRVTLQHSRTTKFEQLTMSHLGQQNVAYPDVFEHGTATHVVTGIVYGANAFFVFDYEASLSETKQDIQGNLKAVIKKIPLISIEGEGALTINDQEKEKAAKLNCKFYGDYAIESNPVTYEEAIKIYSTLPKLLGKNEEKAVPVKVWLYPLKKLDSRAAQLVRDISINLILDAEAAMEELNEVNMTCNDMMKHPVAISFPQIQTKIKKFCYLCNQHKLTFQKQLAKSLPAIRGGGKEEEILVDILSKKGQSPFSSTHLQEYLDKIEQEMTFVNSYLGALKNVRTISTESELNELLHDLGIEHIVSFNFTSLNEEEPYLLDLECWLKLQFQNQIQDPTANSVYEKQVFNPWYSNTEIIKKTRHNVKAFRDFFNVNESHETTQFIVASVSEQNNPGASIYLYETGELLSTKFEPPAKPHAPLSRSITHDSIELSLKPSDIGREEIERYKIEYRFADQENWSAFDTNGKEEKFTIKKLKPNARYQVRYSAVCKAGLSTVSDNSKTIKTLPTSPPGMLLKRHVGQFFISVNWAVPAVIADGVSINDYKAEYQAETGEGHQEENELWFKQRTGTKNEVCITGLKPNTTYKIRVSAVCEDVGTSLPSDEIIIATLKEENEKLSTFLRESTLHEEGHPSIYLLNTVCDKHCRKFSLGKRTYTQTDKTILVVGATGAGKTTLINGMINYILGVEWKDDVRFKLINEVTNKTQAESQTSEITAYAINFEKNVKIPYSLTVIDTPGFGHTGGLEQDKSIVEQIKEFFTLSHGIDHLNAVCFVVQASLAHLTHTQKYIFDSILSVFGSNIKDNIQVLVTFADGKRPPVLDAINEFELPCPRDAYGFPIHFKFNNSALFASNADSGDASFNFDKMFWKMGLKSFETFFASLRKMKSTGQILQNVCTKKNRV